MEDMLSSLPDHVLLSILDRVDVRTAARAGILSRRWRHLPWLLSQLDIEARSFLPPPLTVRMTEDLHPAMAAFTKVIESFLAAPTSERTIKSLRLQFYLMEKMEEYTSCIGNSLGEAIDGGKVAGYVELFIAAYLTKPKSSDMHAHLLMRFVCASPNVFGRLNKLRLHCLRFGGSDDIAILLSSCKHLEELILFKCDCGDWEVLEINAPDSQLKELLFAECDFERIELLRVPKLTRLTCDSWITLAAPLSLGCVPWLHQLNICNDAYPWQVRLKLSELLGNAAHIEHLSLHFYGGKIWIQPEDPKQLVPAFNKLKILVLQDIFYECDLTWTMLLLRAAPVLETFQIQVYNHVCELERDDERKLFPLSADLLQKASDFKHYFLKELKIIGFMAEDKQIQFIRLVLERAVNLKNVILTENDPCDVCNATELQRSTFPGNEDEKDLIVMQLKEGISSPVQIIIRQS